MRLLAKDGGKSSLRPEARREQRCPAIYGLILAGGASSRMQRDKAALKYGARRQLERAFELLARHVTTVFVSVRADQNTRSRAGASAA